MAEDVAPLVFHGGQSNYYARDVERLATFYRDTFGFAETYRTPKDAPPEHVELRLGAYLIGISSLEAGRRIHHLPLDPGEPRGEIVLWTSGGSGARDAVRRRRALHPRAAQL